MRLHRGMGLQNINQTMLFRLSVPAAPVLQIPQKSEAGMTLRWSAVVKQNFKCNSKALWV
jgi:hypothetical protein